MTNRIALVQFQTIGSVPVAVPADQHSEELFAKANEGVTYRIEPKRSRNPSFHRKCMALIQDCFNNQEDYEHFEPFREAMKIECGWVDFTTTTVRESVLAEYVIHRESCATRKGYDPYNSSPVECTCGLTEALQADTVATHIKTKSQGFDQCSEEDAAELWPRIKAWAVQYIGHEAVNRYEGGML